MTSHTQSLDALEATVNSILLNIGSAFNAPANANSDKYEQTRSRLRSTIPEAIDNFHGALDVLEGDLIRATAVISRDLVVLQTTSNDPTTIMKDDTLQTSNDTQQQTPHIRSTIAPEIANSTDLGSDAIMIDAGVDGAEASVAENGRPLPDDLAVESVEKVDTKSDVGPTNNELHAGPNGSGSMQELGQGADQPKPQAADLGVVAAARAGDETVSQDLIGNTKKDEPDPLKSESAVGLNDGSDLVDTGAIDQPAGDATMNTDPIVAPLDGKEADPSSNADFGSLLPGLDMYANDPNGDPLNGIEGFNDMSTSNTFNESTNEQFNETGNDQFNDFSEDLFGESTDMANDFTQNNSGFDDLMSFDAGNPSNAEAGGGGLDLFDEKFFNLAGT